MSFDLNQRKVIVAETLGGLDVLVNCASAFGRMGSVQEVADVALFLASDYARWITGQTLVVDGGQML